jgi:hypothetical protein
MPPRQAREEDDGSAPSAASPVEQQECSVCIEHYDTDAPAPGDADLRPRVLACGHTLCSACVASILGDPPLARVCPHCRHALPAGEAASVPLDFGIIDAMRARSAAAAAGGSVSAPFVDGHLLSQRGSIDRSTDGVDIAPMTPIAPQSQDAHLLSTISASHLEILREYLGDVQMVSREGRPRGEERIEATPRHLTSSRSY